MLGVLFRFHCKLVLLGTLSVAPIVSADFRISSYHDMKVLLMLVLMDFTLSMTLLTILKASRLGHAFAALPKEILPHPTHF